MAQAGMAEPEHTGTGTSHSSFGAQLNGEGVQANWDTTESGHREETQPTRHGQPPANRPSSANSAKGPCQSSVTLGSPVVPGSVGDISKILQWGTPAAAPGIKIIKPPAAPWHGASGCWGGEQGCSGPAWHSMVAWHQQEQWLWAHRTRTDALQGDGCSAREWMLCREMDAVLGDGCCYRTMLCQPALPWS